MRMHQRRILIRGAGDLASAVGWRLHKAGFQVVMTEVANPLAVRRRVSFCEAIWEKTAEVMGVTACRIESPADAQNVLERREIPILVDPTLKGLQELKPHVLVDAVMAKKNLGNHMGMAPLVIGVGPGFYAGRDVHMVVESKRGHNLGRVIIEGEAIPDTGVPGFIGGYAAERVLRAPADGILTAELNLGAVVSAGEQIAVVNGIPLRSEINGLLRGLIRPGLEVKRGMKVGDVDPRGDIAYLDTISDKGLAVAGGVLEGVCRVFNR